MSKAAIVVLGLAVKASLFGQAPTIFPRGIVNAASFAPAGLPSGSIARGSIFNIFGSRLGPATLVQGGYPLQATLSGVSIKLIQGATQLDVLPLYVSAGQLAAILPSTAPLGKSSLRVTYNGAASTLTTVNVVSTSLGLFTGASDGNGPGAIQNVLANGTVPVNTVANPAQPGQTIQLYATGLGAITAPDNAAPPAGNLPTTVEAWVAGINAQVTYQGRSPCCAGLDQINIVIPANSPQGCWVPVYLRAGGLTSNAATIAIGPQGSTCSDTANSLSSTFVKGGNLGVVRLVRANNQEDVGVVTAGQTSSDVFTYHFAQTAANPFAFSPLFSLPPPGSCNVFQFAGDYWGDTAIPSINTTTRGLTPAATFTLSGGAQSQSIDATHLSMSLGAYAAIVPAMPNQLALSPGTNYTLSAQAGADVGAFSAQLAFPQPFTWTGRNQLVTVNRGQALALSWTGLPSGQYMAILGGNVDLPTNSSAIFYCLAPKDTTSFSIPTAILGAMPATRPDVRQSKGVIYLLTATPANATTFSAPGLNSAGAIAGHMIGKTVVFQ